MKLISKFAAVVLSAVLMVSCGQKEGATQVAVQNGGNSVIAPQGSIVYIQMDSLINQYDMFNDLKSELEAKIQVVQDDLRKKGNAWEKTAADFENKINKGLLTRSQAETQQQSILQRQRELQELSQQKQLEMQEEEAVMLRKVMDAIQTYLNSYNETHRYALILTTSAATNTVMVGDSSLDITADVLKGLNEEYIKTKSKK